MNKKYTKKQIQEAIVYWQNKLNTMNESYESRTYNYVTDPYLYITQLNSSFNTPLRKIGASRGSETVREDPETFAKKLHKYNTCVVEDWQPAWQLVLTDEDGSKIFTYEKELFDLLAATRVNNKELFSATDDEVKNAILEFKQRHPTCDIISFMD